MVDISNDPKKPGYNLGLSIQDSLTSLCSNPYISSYRLFRCPAVECQKTLSPSTLLQHFEADHKHLHPLNLKPGAKVTTDVTAALRDFMNKTPNILRFIKIQTQTTEVIPLLVNVCWLPYNDDSNRNTEKRACLWLSSVCNFENWFSMNFINKNEPQTSITKICKPVLAQHTMNTLEMLQDINVMIIELDLSSSICQCDKRQKLEVTMYRT